MNRLPDLLRMVLRDFCFVEWYEVNELAALVKTGQVKFDVGLLQRQLTEAIELHEFPLGEVNELTGEEFESSDDARSWMKDVRMEVFGLGYPSNSVSRNFGFFTGFSPQRDPDAAMKFSLNCILMEDRIEHLSWLATDGHQFGGVSGEPGWEIERRDSSSSADASGYESWPEWASFRAYVDPSSYSLAHPEFYMSGESFYGLLCTALDSYIKSEGLDVAAAKALLDDVHLKSGNWSLG